MQSMLFHELVIAVSNKHCIVQMYLGKCQKIVSHMLFGQMVWNFCNIKFSCDSKPVKQEVYGTVILIPLVFPGLTMWTKCGCVCAGNPYWRGRLSMVLLVQTSLDQLISYQKHKLPLLQNKYNKRLVDMTRSGS